MNNIVKTCRYNWSHTLFLTLQSFSSTETDTHTCHSHTLNITISQCYYVPSLQLRLQLWEAYCYIRSICSQLRGNDITDSALSTDSSMDESSETSSAKDLPMGSLQSSLLELRRLTQNLLDGNESTVRHLITHTTCNLQHIQYTIHIQHVITHTEYAIHILDIQNTHTCNTQITSTCNRHTQQTKHTLLFMKYTYIQHLLYYTHMMQYKHTQNTVHIHSACNSHTQICNTHTRPMTHIQPTKASTLNITQYINTHTHTHTQHAIHTT